MDEAPQEALVEEFLEAPYAFAGVRLVAEVRRDAGHLGPDVETAQAVRVAGRVMRLRRQGRMIFAELRDSSGGIQLWLRADRTRAFDLAAAELVLGDWIGADGVLATTRAGELSVLVDSWVRLAHARRSFGDKWRGVRDPDVRYRQRYVDLWANPGVRERFLARSRMVRALRDELDRRGYVEVETPILQPVASGAAARPFVTHHNALDMDLYLRIAPELYLKRLVVGGIERVFELGRDFRNEGISPRHNPEFTMLEAYEAYGDIGTMRELAEALLVAAARAVLGDTRGETPAGPVDLTPPYRAATMEELVSEALGRTVSLDEPDELVAEALRRGLELTEPEGGRALVALYEELVERELVEPTFVLDFPRSVSPLARAHRSRPARAERFELVVGGRELVNAFSELVDPDDQRARFEDQLRQRSLGDAEAMAYDADYVRALEYGLPPTGGLGLGVDRLAMLLTGQTHIKEVILFPTLRPEPTESEDPIGLARALEDGASGR
jgi:lysyl-tRNA synthetase class 2